MQTGGKEGTDEMTDRSAKEEQAMALFKQGYNCSQAVVAVFCEEAGLERAQALRLASSFGGGMGRMREVCGAVSGMFLVAGALYGTDRPDDQEGKKEHYARIQELAARFKEQTGSIICRELLGAAGKDDAPVPSERTETYYKKRPCVEMVALAVNIMETYIAEQKNNK